MKKSILPFIFLLSVLVPLNSETVDLVDNSRVIGKLLSITNGIVSVQTDYGLLTLTTNQVRRITHFTSSTATAALFTNHPSTGIGVYTTPFGGLGILVSSRFPLGSEFINARASAHIPSFSSNAIDGIAIGYDTEFQLPLQLYQPYISIGVQGGLYNKASAGSRTASMSLFYASRIGIGLLRFSTDTLTINLFGLYAELYDSRAVGGYLSQIELLEIGLRY